MGLLTGWKGLVVGTNKLLVGWKGLVVGANKLLVGWKGSVVGANKPFSCKAEGMNGGESGGVLVFSGQMVELSDVNVVVTNTSSCGDCGGESGGV